MWVQFRVVRMVFRLRCMRTRCRWLWQLQSVLQMGTTVLLGQLKTALMFLCRNDLTRVRVFAMEGLGRGLDTPARAALTTVVAPSTSY